MIITQIVYSYNRYNVKVKTIKILIYNNLIAIVIYTIPFQRMSAGIIILMLKHVLRFIYFFWIKLKNYSI